MIKTRRVDQDRVALLTDRRGEGVGSTEHDSASLDGIKTLPDHTDNGARGHVFDEAGEESLAFEVGIIYKKDILDNERCNGKIW